MTQNISLSPLQLYETVQSPEQVLCVNQNETRTKPEERYEVRRLKTSQTTVPYFNGSLGSGSSGLWLPECGTLCQFCS